MLALGALRVLQELETHRWTLSGLLECGHGVQQHRDGVAAADGVGILAQVLVEAGGVQLLDHVHAHPVQTSDALVDLAAHRLVIERVVEARTPVTEVGRDDKHDRRVDEVLGEDLTVQLLLGWGQAADHDGHDGELVLVVLHDLGDVGQLHLQGMLVLVHAQRQLLKVSGGLQLLVHLLVDVQVVEGRGEAGHGAEAAAAHAVVVRGAENENLFDQNRTDLAIGEGGAGPAIRVAGVRTDHGLCRTVAQLGLSQPRL